MLFIQAHNISHAEWYADKKKLGPKEWVPLIRRTDCDRLRGIQYPVIIRLPAYDTRFHRIDRDSFANAYAAARAIIIDITPEEENAL